MRQLPFVIFFADQAFKVSITAFFFDIPVADEMEGAVLPGPMATGAILVNQRRNVLVERHFGRAGQQGPEE